VVEIVPSLGTTAHLTWLTAQIYILADEPIRSEEAVMLGESISIVRRNLNVYIVVLATFFALFVFDKTLNKVATNSGLFIILLLLSTWVQAAVLFDSTFSGLYQRNPSAMKLRWGFAIKNVGLIAIAMLIAIPLWTLVLRHFPLSTSTLVAILAISLIFLLCYACTLGLLGTWLPASIFGVGATFSDAFGRGKVAFYGTSWRIALGLVVPWIASMVAAVVTLDGPDTLVSDGSFNWKFAIAILVSGCAQISSLTYLSVVLTRVYINTENIAPSSTSL
jgi:hypothetical protein